MIQPVRVWSVSLGLVLLLSPCVTMAETDGGKSAGITKPKKSAEPRHRYVYNELLAGRINPLGLVSDFSLGYRLKLFDRPGILFSDTHLTIEANTYLSPADCDIGPRVVLRPLAVLQLSAKVAYYGTFGTFGILQGFQSPSADSSDSRQKERKEQGLDYAATGVMVTLSARVQAKVGPVAIRDTLTAVFADLELKPQDTVFHHTSLDVLFPDGGWALKNEADLLYITGFGLILGARYTLVHAFYPDSAYFPGEPTDSADTTHHRVGPLAVYTLFDRPGSARIDKLSLFLIVQWYAKHRYRTGADTHGALPQIVIGAALSGDLLPWSS